MKSPKVPDSTVARMQFLGNMMFEPGLQVFSDRVEACPSTNGQVRYGPFPGLVQYSLGPGSAGGGGGGEKKKRQRPKKLVNEASRLERGPFTLPNLPLWLASLSDFSAYFFPLSSTAEPG